MISLIGHVFKSHFRAGATAAYLDPKDRPLRVQECVQNAFQNLAKISGSYWHYNGRDKYDLCGISERKWAAAMMPKFPKDETVRILDVGGGNFQWSLAMAKFFQVQGSGSKVEIFGVRGEQYLGKPVIELGRCQVHNIGGFKIENPKEQFRQRGLSLEGKLHYIVARWSLRHCVDPLGSLVSYYDDFLAEGGAIAFDNFAFLYEREDARERKGFAAARRFNDHLFQLFLRSGKTFAFKKDEESSGQYMLVKHGPLRLPLAYAGIQENVDQRWRIYSRCITKFRAIGGPYL